MTTLLLPSPRRDRSNEKNNLSPLDESRLRHRLRKIAPSETWVDDQIVTVIEPRPDGCATAVRRFAGGFFPPGGRHATEMKWCRSCGRYTPPACVALIEHRRCRAGDVVSSTLRCDDCRIAADLEARREVYDANEHLRPAGSSSFCRRSDLRKRK